MFYTIRALDPGGEFLDTGWETSTLPRIGENVMLPVDVAAIQWQELTVEEIAHYPVNVEVWLGGTTGWEAGSVTRIFAAASELQLHRIGL